MGPKGKSLRFVNRGKNLAEAGLFTRMVKEASEKVSKLKVELQQLVIECSQLTSDIHAREVEKSALSGKLAELKYQCQQLDDRANKFVGVIETKNTAIRQQNGVLLNLDKQLTNLAGKQEDQKISISGLRKELQDGCQEKKSLQTDISSLKADLKFAGLEELTVKKKFRNLQSRLRRKKKVLSENPEIRSCKKCGKTKWNVYKVGKRMAISRQNNPFSSDLCARTRQERCLDFFKAAKLCAGSSKLPALCLLLETIGRNFSVDAILKGMSTSKCKKVRNIKHEVIKRWNKSYYNSVDNQNRSVAIMYANHVMSKRKWNSMRKSGKQADHEGNGVVNVLPYDRVMSFIKSINMGKVSNLTELDKNIGERVGRFRDIKEYVPRLASFYLNVDGEREDDLLTLNAVPKLCFKVEVPRGTIEVENVTDPKVIKAKEKLDNPERPKLYQPFTSHYNYNFVCESNRAKNHSMAQSYKDTTDPAVQFVRKHANKILEAKKQKPYLKSKVFDMLFGGDGAPAVGTVFLLGFVNVGKRLMSSKEAFLIFGADVDETDAIVEKYLARIVKDFDFLEENVFIVKGGGRMCPVEFRLGGDSSDMKMLCYLAGQLSNSARFFTNFANVFKSGDAHLNPKFKFGDHWKPFNYKDMVNDGILAEEQWKRLVNSKGSTKLKDLKAKLATYVGEVLKSRQVCRPRLGKYILKAKADPLHIKNNVCFDMFIRLWVLIYGGVDVDKDVVYDELADDCPQHVLVRFVRFVKKDMKLNRLSNQMIKWCNETKGNIENSFIYRFQGEESNSLLDKFPNLVDKFLGDVSGLNKKYMFKLFHLCLLLREMISYSTRVTDFNHEILEKMKVVGRRLYVATVKFSRKMSPSLWVLCNITPYHAADMLETYGLGLGAISMEPREQKHQVLARYSENTTPQDKWPMIMRHDFMASIYIRENGFDECKYVKSKHKYLPVPHESKCMNCGLIISGKSCKLCGDPMYLEVEDEVDLCVLKYDISGELEWLDDDLMEYHELDSMEVDETRVSPSDFETGKEGESEEGETGKEGESEEDETGKEGESEEDEICDIYMIVNECDRRDCPELIRSDGSQEIPSGSKEGDMEEPQTVEVSKTKSKRKRKLPESVVDDLEKESGEIVEYVDRPVRRRKKKPKPEGPVNENGDIMEESPNVEVSKGIKNKRKRKLPEPVVDAFSCEADKSGEIVEYVDKPVRKRGKKGKQEAPVNENGEIVCVDKPAKQGRKKSKPQVQPEVNGEKVSAGRKSKTK